MKKERGITIITLAVTIIILLILSAIGINAITNEDAIENSENIAKFNKRQEYIEVLELTISKAQINFATKEIDKDYFEKIQEILEPIEAFKGATINLINYEEKDNQHPQDNEINAIKIITKEGYEFIIDKESEIHIIKESEN